jgi:hypothetical protein
VSLLVIKRSLFASLPVNVIRSSAVQQVFSDSTHQLWALETIDRRALFVKTLDRVDTPFWHIMKDLFRVDLGAQLGDYAQVYRSIAALTPLNIPKLVACASETDQTPAYLLTTTEAGKCIQEKNVTDDMIFSLAQHLSALHFHRQTTWGNLFDSNRSALDWSLVLRRTLLQFFPKDESISNFKCQPCCFVPMMPDLRWDQFFVSNDQLSALVDLDAFVFAPIELDFVLLEYLLSSEQLAVWCEAYLNAGGVVPDIGAVRDVYRKLLFAMNVLGEDDLSCWLERSSYFA